MTPMTDPAREEVQLSRIVAESVTRAATLKPGDYLDAWEENEHLYGAPSDCPFCRTKQTYTSFWYNGPGSPPSYSFTCDECGAHGPTSSGWFKGDHYGALVDAVKRWNEAHAPTPTNGGTDA